MNVLFVCTGNTCRSPMAEGYLNSKKTHAAKSAGIYAFGEAVFQNSAEVMGEIGIDISSHVSQCLTPELIYWADRIYCMSDSHLLALKSLGVTDDKLFLLGNGISDPYGQDLTVYRRCRDQIIGEIDKLFPDVSVRRANMTTDSEDIAALEKICFSTPWSANALTESETNGTTFFVAEANGKFAGYIGIDTVLDEGYVTNIAVLPEFRKLGVGAALLSHTLLFAKEKGLAFISLEVRRSNIGAQKLYQKFGFNIEGERKNFYQNPKEDALIFTKRF